MSECSISGRCYSVSFCGQSNKVSVSYEPGDDVFFILIFSRKDGGWSDIDDRLKTPRLADLNRRFFSDVTNEERAANEEVFRKIKVCDAQERLMLKAAKELRLVLPKYLAV